MAENNDFTTPQEIYLRLAAVYKQKLTGFNDRDIIRWCAEVVTEFIRDPVRLYLYKGDPEKTDDLDKLDIIDLKTLLPINIHRLLDVFDEYYARIKYYKDGVYLHFDSDCTLTKCYINYYGIPCDPKTGYPYIRKGYEQACYNFCVMKMYEEDYANQKVSAEFYHNWESRFGVSLSAISSGFRDISRNDLEEINKIMCNMVVHPGWIPLYNLD
ncbi:hypothetical protein A2Z67_02655 [Candidatus Woesebacteria bacterium RBG_13_36_22]|uniref:Uncharacterized protein n=1 Tax=Candidatus Woesebacteria bacterium RBG_13_36_22 TaxID=1802478 RepID=A0A1F7X1D2_9BACT|nr:MAG: hypothetical protein A2Z67_02655 [Candidatus Woesebacteria bacterium RBG_13_36_22]